MKMASATHNLCVLHPALESFLKEKKIITHAEISMKTGEFKKLQAYHEMHRTDFIPLAAASVAESGHLDFSLEPQFLCRTVKKGPPYRTTRFLEINHSFYISRTKRKVYPRPIFATRFL